jgi:hypothetical protein
MLQASQTLTKLIIDQDYGRFHLDDALRLWFTDDKYTMQSQSKCLVMSHLI